jgi:D-3-phosphoglycerate dehydrogenase
LKVLIADKIAQAGIDLLKENDYEVVEAWDVPKDELHTKIDDVDGIVIRSATKLKGDLLAAAKNLKVVGRAGIGLDNVDLEKCEERGIVVHNTPTATTNSVAELALTYLLALTRPIVKATNSLREHEWIKKELKRTEIAGKILGIIGCGRIGYAFAEKANALGMDVLAYDIVDIPDDKNILNQVDFDKVISESDYISLHLPLTPKTKHMISDEEFEKMKDTACIINCARGGTIDEEALYKALKEGKIRGAGLDVWEAEPIQLESSKKLLELEQVLGTPHIGAQTAEGQERAGVQVAEKIMQELEK